MMEKNKNGKVVAFINMKGGVGKTTLCLSLGEYLAMFKNKSVLMIDVDPQFNLTQTFLKEYDKEDYYLGNIKDENGETTKPLTIYDLYNNSRGYRISDKKDMVSPKEIIQNLDSNDKGGKLDIIYGSLELFNLENNLSFKNVLYDFINLNSLNIEYDFIFIDCPPTVSLFTSTAINASDYYLIPNKLDRYSIMGIELLNTIVNDEINFEKVPLKIKPLGIVNMIVVTAKTPKQEDLDLQITYESLGLVRDIGIFENCTKRTGNLMGSKSNIMSKHSNTRTEIKKITNEFLEKIEGIEKNG